MTCFDFRLLDEVAQIIELYKRGVYIGKRKIGRETVLLYQVDSFYVEIYYRSYRRFVHKILVSETTAILDPYLENIDVDDVVGQNQS